MKQFSATCAALLLALATFAQQAPSVIPKPVEMQVKRGEFRLTAATTIGYNHPDALRTADALATHLARPTGFRFFPKKRLDGNIRLTLLDKPSAQLGDEGYALDVTPTTVFITANRPAGLFYGVQTLLQLFPKEIESQQVVRKNWSAPAVSITDYPRFGWRGAMLDVSRHFFTKEEVKRHIDQIARYKYNVFHWHLTDDQGWRVEIKSLPKLTQIGACRVPRYGKWGEYEAPKPGEAATDCGFYTQAEIREIVAYAAERHVSILPEIDVPGHSMAAIAAYPELCCTRDTSVRVNPGSDFADWYGNGQFKMFVDNSLNPSDEGVYAFLDKVFGEIATLFPYPYIHMGGDECYHGYWENDPGCQALMKREGLKTSHELQSYFVKRAEKIVQSKGKKLIGWDEILEGGLAPEATVMSWRGFEGGIEAAKLGHNVVMTPNDFVYTDLLQGDPANEPDQTSYKRVRLEKAYAFEPVPDGIDPKFVLGGQINLWSEKVPTYRQAEYMTFPRAWALADIYWSPKGSKNWENFLARMENHFERLDAANMNYARSAFDAIVQPTLEGEKLTVSLRSEVPGLDFYYTINETLPDAFASRYTQPFEVPKGPVTLKVITYRGGKPVGKMLALSREELVRRAKMK
jgi:hexosaminidase